MVATPVVRPTMKIDIFKFEGKVFNGYRDGDYVFYLSVTNETGFFQDVTPDFFSSRSAYWIKANDIFEDLLEYDPTLHCFKNKLIFVRGRNHRLLAWKSYIDRVHKDDY